MIWSPGGGYSVYEKLIHYFELGKANVWLALDNQKAVGYAQFFQKNNERVHLNAVTVAKSYQKQGIGSMLIEAVEQSTKECGANVIELFCNESNENARLFYKRHHYNVERLLMTKPLV